MSNGIDIKAEIARLRAENSELKVKREKRVRRAENRLPNFPDYDASQFVTVEDAAKICRMSETEVRMLIKLFDLPVQAQTKEPTKKGRGHSLYLRKDILEVQQHVGTFVRN